MPIYIGNVADVSYRQNSDIAIFAHKSQCTIVLHGVFRNGKCKLIVVLLFVFDLEIRWGTSNNC